ncbi:hypothetical protein [Saccharothrix luteola]|uniref:hypothetical protein n=1 Tax=Saccharothrix luteola TaxID=2893018 RepID=UPI001E4D9D0C|nr:hypothetical protein [Saccharothrix luteola]MCC8251563.1 hypothetical protein [Saccharothrix luteola]
MPGHAYEHVTWSKFVEAMLTVGCTQPEFTAVSAAKQQLVEQLSPDRTSPLSQADRDLAVTAYADATFGARRARFGRR